MNLHELKSRLREDDVQEAAVQAPASTTERGSAVNGQRRAAGKSIGQHLEEVEMACRMGYLLCQCTWPPQIMVLGADGYEFHCPRCKRSRDF